MRKLPFLSDEQKNKVKCAACYARPSTDVFEWMELAFCNQECFTWFSRSLLLRYERVLFYVDALEEARQQAFLREAAEDVVQVALKEEEPREIQLARIMGERNKLHDFLDKKVESVTVTHVLSSLEDPLLIVTLSSQSDLEICKEAFTSPPGWGAYPIKFVVKE